MTIVKLSGAFDKHFVQIKHQYHPFQLPALPALQHLDPNFDYIERPILMMTTLPIKPHRVMHHAYQLLHLKDCSFLPTSTTWVSRHAMGCCRIGAATLVMTKFWDPSGPPAPMSSPSVCIPEVSLVRTVRQCTQLSC